MSRKQTSLIVSGVVIVCLGISALVVLEPFAPRYQGKTSNQWLSQPISPPISQETVAAIRFFGSAPLPKLARPIRWLRPVKHSRPVEFIYNLLHLRDKGMTAFYWCRIAVREVPKSVDSMIQNFEMEDLIPVLTAAASSQQELRNEILEVEWNSQNEQARQKAKAIRLKLQAAGIVQPLDYEK